MTMTIAVVRPQHEYDDIAFALMCLEHGLPCVLRRKAQLTQQALADRVGMERLLVHKWEHGTMPNMRDMDTLARYGKELRQLAQTTGMLMEKE